MQAAGISENQQPILYRRAILGLAFPIPLDFLLLPCYTMLRTMHNIVNIRNTIMREVLGLLKQRLPAKWAVESASKASVLKTGILPDGVFILRGADGKSAHLMIKAKAHIEPKDVYALKAQMQYRSGVPLVVSPFLSFSTRKRLKEVGLSYADATGNFWIVSSRPGLYVETQGVEQDPNRGERPTRSLKGAKAGRIIRALCDGRPPFAVRKLAGQVRTNPGYVSRVLSFLENEDLIEREMRGPVTLVRWRQLIERWARDYSFLGSNRVVSYLEPRDVSQLASKLATVARPLSITGSSAAAAVSPVAPTRLIAAYVESPEDVAKELDLRPAASGANVLLAEPYDPIVFDGIRDINGVPYAALSQVAVDLLTSPGRGPAEAQALLDWMQANESIWRR